MGNFDLNLGSPQCIKYLLFVLNFFFVITGIILVGTGSSIQSNYSYYAHFLETQYFSVPTLLVTIGIIIFIIAFFGCYGAIRENYCMILTFAALMIFIFLLELIAGIYGYVLRSEAVGVVGNKMKESLKLYNNETNIEVIELWDGIQKQFGCCGVDSPMDWVESWDEKVHPDWKVNRSLPVSCCEEKYGRVGGFNCAIVEDKAKINYYEEGCLVEFSKYIQSHALQLGGFGLGIAFCQGLGIWFALFLAKTVKKSYLNM